MLKTIYFDLGNVLIFFNMPKMVSQISNCTGIPPEEIQGSLLKGNLRKLHETGVIDTEQLIRMIQKGSPKSFAFQEFTAAFSDVFTPNTELWPIVEQLKREGVRLVLLSNIGECHFHFIDSHYPILHQFDHKILSYEVGAWKPDPHIFQKALEHAQCKKEECFYIDDVPEFIASARKVGLQGEVFIDVPKLKQQLIDRGCHFL